MKLKYKRLHFIGNSRDTAYDKVRKETLWCENKYSTCYQNIERNVQQRVPNFQLLIHATI